MGILIGCSVGGLSLLLSLLFIVREYRRRAIVHCTSPELSITTLETVGYISEIRKNDMEDHIDCQELD